MIYMWKNCKYINFTLHLLNAVILVLIDIFPTLGSVTVEQAGTGI